MKVNEKSIKVDLRVVYVFFVLFTTYTTLAKCDVIHT